MPPCTASHVQENESTGKEGRHADIRMGTNDYSQASIRLILIKAI